MKSKWQICINDELTDEQIEHYVKQIRDSRSLVMVADFISDQFIVCGPNNEESIKQAEIINTALNAHTQFEAISGKENAA